MEPQDPSAPDVQLLSHALEACIVGVVIADARQADWPLIYVNPAFEHLSGYRAAEIIGRNCRFLQGEAQDQQARHAIRTALDQGQGVTTVLRNYRKDGTMFYNELTLSPIRDASGTLTHFLGFQNDVTAREEALQREVQARTQLTATLSRVTDGFMSFDRDWNFTYVNEAAASISGRRIEDFAGRNLLTSFPEFRNPSIGHAVTQAEATGSTQSAISYMPPFDRWVEMTVYPGEDGMSMFTRDVTERQETERDLEVSEERFFKVFQASPVAAFIIRQPDKHFVEINDAFLRQSGYTREEVIGHSSQDLGFWTDQADREVAWSMVDGNVSMDDREVLFHSRTGVKVHGVLSIIPTEVAGEACVIGFVRDVTEEKRARDQLQASEERFAKVFLSSPIAIFITRQSDKHFVEINDEFLRQSGYTREEVIGHSSQDLGFWTDQADREVAWSMVDGNVSMDDREVLFHSRTGVKVHGVLSIIPTEVAGEACVIGFVRDVTEEKRARDQLQASEERFAKVFDASPVAIVVTQVSTGECIDVNSEFLRRSGYAREDVIGRVLIDLNVWVNPQEWDDFMRTLQEDGRVFNREVQFRMKSGGVSDSLVSVVPVTISGDLCMVMLLRDVTLEKQAQRGLAESEERHRQTASRLQRTLDLSLDLINSIDAEGRFVTMSAACQQILGYAPEELIGRTYLDFVHPDDRAITAQEDDRITAGRATTSFQNRYLHKNGSVVWLEWAAISLPDDPLIYCVARDVTLRRAAEEDQAFLAAIVSASHNAIIGLSLAGLWPLTGGAACCSPCQPCQT